MRVRMELFAKIRRDARVEGMSIRGLAKRYQVGRDTVRQALSDPVPPTRKKPVRSSPRLDPFKPAIDTMLKADTTAPRKQRHTARRILARLGRQCLPWIRRRPVPKRAKEPGRQRLAVGRAVGEGDRLATQLFLQRGNFC